MLFKTKIDFRSMCFKNWGKLHSLSSGEIYCSLLPWKLSDTHPKHDRGYCAPHNLSRYLGEGMGGVASRYFSFTSDSALWLQLCNFRLVVELTAGSLGGNGPLFTEYIENKSMEALSQ